MLSWTVEERFTAISPSQDVFRVFHLPTGKYVSTRVSGDITGMSKAETLGEFDKVADALQACEKAAEGNKPIAKSPDDPNVFSTTRLIQEYS